MSWSRQFLDSLLSEPLPSITALAPVTEPSSPTELEIPATKPKPKPRRRSIGRRALDNLDRIRAIVAMCGLWLFSTGTTYLVVRDFGLNVLLAVIMAIFIQAILTGCELYLLRASGCTGLVIAVPLIGIDAFFNVRGIDLLFPAASIEFAWTNPIMWVALIGGVFMALLPELILNTLRGK